MGCSRTWGAALFAVMLALAPLRAWAFEDFTMADVRAHLAKPGTTLLAVEFYATWCKPCIAAIPQWVELQKKYRDLGLRLVVISVQPGETGSCNAPKWTPDRVVCDEEGNIQNHWGAAALPQAFLWNWQGDLLVQHGKVEDVAAAVREHFKRAPRILVSAPVDAAGQPLKGGLAAEIRAEIQREFKRAAKFEIIAGDATRAELRKLRQKGFSEEFREDQQCELGQAVSANSKLDVRLTGGGTNQKLRLELYSIEKGCLLASGAAAYVKGKADVAAAGAAESLISALLGDVAMPGAGGEISLPPVLAQPVTPLAPPVQGGPKVAAGAVTSASGTLIVHVKEPANAYVEIKGPGGFKQTGVKQLNLPGVKPGSYTVALSAEGYEPKEETIPVPADEVTTKNYALDKLGGLRVTGTPVGAKVSVTGPRNFSNEGGLPWSVADTWLGQYTVKVTREGYEPFEQSVTVAAGAVAKVVVNLVKGESMGDGAGAVSPGDGWHDPQSGLTWQVTPPSKTMSWADAKSYCSSLSLGGYSDWRLPSIGELRSLIRGCATTQTGGSCNIGESHLAWSGRSDSCNGCSAKGGPGVDGMYWPRELKGQCCGYWSSSPVADVGSGAWYVDFNFGFVNGNGVIADGYVRCVF